MNRFPPQPLDADERALAAALPRLHGRSEPDAALDARILAAAHAAALAPSSSPRRRRWPAPLALAASLCLAVGLAWQLREPAPPHAADAKAESTPPATALVTTAPADDATGAAPAAAKRSTPTATSTARAVPADTARAAPEASVASRPEAPSPAIVAATPLPPPPPPSPPAPPTAAVMAESAAVQAAPADMGPPAAARTLALPAAMPKARSAEPAERALETQDAPDEDVPPATASSPEVRDAWLRRIGELVREGKPDEARASLAEFRRRYPEAKLPAELRGLEPVPR